MKSPSNEDIGQLISKGDPFRIAVVGFSAIESVLEELISVSLPKKHSLELSRLSPTFKVDLAIGLGVLEIEFKGIVLKLGKIRNIYAHEVNLDTVPFSANELISSMEKTQRNSIDNTKSQDPVGVLGFAVLTTFIHLTSIIKLLGIQKLKRIDMLAEMKALLDEEPMSEDVKKTDAYKELDERIEKRKKEYLKNSSLGKT